jgi:valyl-tRNA synthetase
LRLLLPEKERQDCVHYLMFPSPRPELVDAKIQDAVLNLKSVIETGRKLRDMSNLTLKKPLRSATVISKHVDTLEVSSTG